MQKHQHQQKLTNLNEFKEKAEKIKEKNIYFLLIKIIIQETKEKLRKEKLTTYYLTNITYHLPHCLSFNI